MRSVRWLVSFLLAALPAAFPAAWARQNAPHVAYVYPAGAQQGATVQVKVGGQFLANASEAYVSGSGIQAEIVEYIRPMNAMQATQLRERIQELQKQTMDAAATREIADIRQKLAVFAAGRGTSPVLAENVILKVSLPPDAEPGERELRLSTPQGLSNPIRFFVGRLPEITEPEPVIVAPPLVRPAQARGASQAQPAPPAPNPPEQVIDITLPATVNGQIRPSPGRAQGRPGQPFTPGDVDRYRFLARQGQQLVIAAAARDLIPYLADAVPGWFQATLALYDSEGIEVAYNDDYRFHPDPVLYYVIPRDGAYTVEIKDSIYRGREDFVYRIEIGELPFVTNVFPLGGRTGARVPVAVKGWNLPVEALTIDSKGPGVHSISVRAGEMVSNKVPFLVDALPEGLDKEPNNAQTDAQRIALPIIVNGRVDLPGDSDVFRFEGEGGETIVAEIHARRLGSPLDSWLRLSDATGRQLAFNDDHEDKGSGLNTHHADSLIFAKLPAKGTYYLSLGDMQQKGGGEYAYRLRISRPRPDFELRVVPSSINAAGGMSVPITVYALRKDGFSGEIALSLKGAPRGFLLSGGVVPAGQDSIRFTVATPSIVMRQPMSLNLEGRAVIEGHEVTRPAKPAEDMMQAFAYRHLVPAADLKIVIPRRAAARPPEAVLYAQTLAIAAGGSVRIPIRMFLQPNNPFDTIQLALSEPPDGITLQEASVGTQGGDIVLQCDASKVKAGMRGNLIVNVTGERTLPAGKANAPAARRRIPLGALPAIPFEIK